MSHLKANTLTSEVSALIRKELLLEWRQKYALNGLLLYIVSTVLVCYLSFNVTLGSTSPITWNTLFWIIILFTAVNAVSKSFSQEREGRQLYYYTLASPQGIIIAKILYNSLLLAVISLLGYLVYSVVLGNPVQDHTLFLVNILLGAIGFSCTLTMVAGIAAKAENNATLMAVLSFPVILPMLILIISISKNAMDGLHLSSSYDDMITLAAVDAIVVVLSLLLFPYLWRS
ncbi:heme exporter protein CcmB [Roseivirga sp. BDSF3-8]|uniref:heme exporter protein CcmB n=1 Tax=Roseivirga sp. BDSF3-8 TaxID=3241598 RepID=UPI003531A577